VLGVDIIMHMAVVSASSMTRHWFRISV